MSKRNIAFVGLLLAVVLASAVLLFRAPAATSPSIAFIGFTNKSPGSAQALVRFSNCEQKRVSWNLYSMAKMTEAGWRFVDPPVVHTIYTNYETTRSSFVVGIPVPSSTEAWRLIFHFQERAPGARGGFDRLNELYEHLFTRHVHLRYNGGVYFLTNDCPELSASEVKPRN